MEILLLALFIVKLKLKDSGAVGRSFVTIHFGESVVMIDIRSA